MFEYDELKIYRGKDIYITDKIVVSQPSLSQIEEFGEKNYFNSVHIFTSVGADLKWQLWDYNQIDYTQIDDYELFVKFISQLVGSKKKVYKELTENPEKYENELKNISKDELEDMLINPLHLVLNIDLADFMPMKVTSNKEKEDEQIILYNPESDITIDRLVYRRLVDVVRKIHGFKRNNQVPANEATKRDLIDDARDEAMAASHKPYKSVLRSLISTLAVYCGQCGDEKIWNMKINNFFEDIKRIGKIEDAHTLLQGAYSGFANLKGIDKTRFDMFADI
ncbi:MAG: hypothetical protein IJV31_00865 [Clostridia bacterium]|nr:hypothetical protein [Clostridia bacterium]MBQ9657302.1 hypothetical protein [Clostridia bacterium]